MQFHVDTECFAVSRGCQMQAGSNFGYGLNLAQGGGDVRPLAWRAVEPAFGGHVGEQLARRVVLTRLGSVVWCVRKAQPVGTGRFIGTIETHAKLDFESVVPSSPKGCDMASHDGSTVLSVPVTYSPELPTAT